MMPMKKKILAVICLFTIVCFASLEAADIKGKVTLSPTEKPYSHGAVLLTLIGAEEYTKAEIKEDGSFLYQDIGPGKYLIKLDLYSVTPEGGEREIEIKEKDETLELTLPLSLSLLDKVLVFTKETIQRLHEIQFGP